MSVCYVLILNYKNWRDTIECLESVVLSKNVILKIIVCDNDSGNDSLKRIQEWAAGKKIDNDYYKDESEDITIKSKITLIQNNFNNGFAAGNNVGLKIIRKQIDAEYIFVLNSDTTIQKDTISNAIAVMEADSKIGICSVKAYNYDDRLPQWNNWYKWNKWIGRAQDIQPVDPPAHCPCNYSGMAFFIRKNCLDKIGLMDEKYFLFFEEHDWTEKCLRNGYKMAFCSKATVFHKGGGTMIGAKDTFRHFYLLRSRLLFTEKFYSYCIPTVYMYECMRGIKYFITGKWSLCKLVFRVLFLYPVKKERMKID